MYVHTPHHPDVRDLTSVSPNLAGLPSSPTAHLPLVICYAANWLESGHLATLHQGAHVDT